VLGATTSCSPYACAGGACRVAPCASKGDCAPGRKCNAATGTCN
jgi:hypothetical protein